MFDAGNYLIEDGLLRFAECGFGEEFEVLGVMVSMEKRPIHRLCACRSGLTLVVCKTLASLGKSLTPSSRILMEESRSCREDRSEETEEERWSAMVDSIFRQLNIIEGRKE